MALRRVERFARVVAALAAMLWGSTAGAAVAQVRIHLLIAADTNDRTIGPSCRADQALVETLFKVHVPRARLSVQTLSGMAVRPQMILRTAGSIAITPDRDTVVFYYSGHGQYDPQSQEHILLPGRQGLRVSSVRRALEQTGARLRVILTDTCSEIVRRPPAVAAPAPGEKISPAFQSLFVEPSGTIVVSCTRPGELARGDSNGGYFTSAFSFCLLGGYDRRFTWDGLLGEINQSVSQQFDDARQTAYLVARADGHAPVPPKVDALVPGGDGSSGGGGGIRFGISAIETERSRQLGGVEVYRVWNGYPATRIRGLDDGQTQTLVGGRDVITHVNGDPIRTEPELRRAIERSPQKMRLRVHDLQTGSAAEYEADLGGSTGGGNAGAPRVRLGVNGAATARGGTPGVLVTFVQGGAAATRLRGPDGQRYSLAPQRDVITHVNGQPVATLAELVAAVHGSPPQITLRVHDLHTGRTADYTADLR